jgi:hypothetical protein
MTRSDVEGRYSAKRSFDIVLADIKLSPQSGVRRSTLEYRTLLNHTKKRSAVTLRNIAPPSQSSLRFLLSQATRLGSVAFRIYCGLRSEPEIQSEFEHKFCGSQRHRSAARDHREGSQGDDALSGWGRFRSRAGRLDGTIEQL